MSTLGRNDNCWCGSGKKYKKCHWSEDQKLAAERAKAEQRQQERLTAMGSPSDGEMRTMYQTMTGRPAPQGPLPADARNAITEYWQMERLTAQSLETLEPERAQWSAYFTEHPEEFDQLATQLAANPRFENHVLTDENSALVRERLGSLPETPEALHPYATEAIAMTLDEEDRTSFRSVVLSLLPDLLEQGKLKEAYVVVTCAERIVESDAPLSAFLEDVVVRSLS